MPDTRHHLHRQLGHQLGDQLGIGREPERTSARPPWLAAVEANQAQDLEREPAGELSERDNDRAGLTTVTDGVPARRGSPSTGELTDGVNGTSGEAGPSPRVEVRTPPPAGPTDAELLDGCRAGNAASWRTLVDRYSRVVYTVALRAGVTAEDAKDITQSTFIALLESGSRIRQDERLASWLITVTQRKAWRARRRLERELVTTELPDRYDDPHETWESVAVIHAALSRLGGPCEQLLTALYLDPANPSYAEIAARMGRAIGTIGPTRARCLEKMRSIIGKDAW